MPSQKASLPSETERDEFVAGFVLEGWLYKSPDGVVLVGLYYPDGLLRNVIKAAPLHVDYDWFTFEMENVG